jgi:hypothetical protein
MPAYKMTMFELNMMNGIFNLGGAAGYVNGVFGCAVSSVGNAMGICVEMAEEEARTHHPVNLRWSRAQIFKVAGPLLGLPNNQFLNLAIACSMVGLSVVGLSTVVVAGTPAAIFLAALALFGDAIGYGAAEHNFTASLGKTEEAAMIGNRRRIQMYLDVEFKKEQSRRPAGRRSVAR